MSSAVSTVTVSGAAPLAGRGGAAGAALPCGRALFHGGANRFGELFGDLISLELRESAPARLMRVHAGDARDATTGGALAAVGGHAAASVVVNGEAALLVFGGINATSADGQTETVAASGALWRGGVWHLLRAGAAAGGSDGAGDAAPVPPVVLDAGIAPGERTGHSLCTVPPPIVLRSDAGVGANVKEEGVAAALSEAPLADAAAALPSQPLRTVLGGDPARSSCVLFGGSSPHEGPLNDCFVLTAEVRGKGGSGGAAEGAAEGALPRLPLWGFSWSEVAASGDTPSPRELHSAFVRPAIVQLLPGGGAEATSSEALVRVLQPPALVLHGGRGADGRPRSDVCVLDLHARAWLPGARSPHALCAAAAAPSPSGLQLLLWGGQASAEALSSGLVRLDTAPAALCSSAAGGSNVAGGSCNGNSAAGGSGSGAAGGSGVVAGDDGTAHTVPTGLHPSTWLWQAVPLSTTPAPRFAAAAAALPDPARGPRACALVVFGGMTAAEDLSEALVVRLDSEN